ncbi:Hypothetical predicted protein, partial [Drosophila guanche]
MDLSLFLVEHGHGALRNDLGGAERLPVGYSRQKRLYLKAPPQAVAQFDAPELNVSVTSSMQVVNSQTEETTYEHKQVEILGIMTPLSQVEGVMPSASFGDTINEDEELSLHEDQLQSNVLQLNVNGHRLELDPSVLFTIAEQPDSCIELTVDETGASSVRA